VSTHSATKQDIEDHFNSQGTGKITEIKLMNGFGFIEYEDALDARDIVPSKSFRIEHMYHTTTNNGYRLSYATL
jgi:RNA recognition motif. (a.k.a. RRM, RBD, or RNP domain)